MACPCYRGIEAPVITSCDVLGNISLASASLGLFIDSKSNGMVEDLIWSKRASQGRSDGKLRFPLHKQAPGGTTENASLAVVLHIQPEPHAPTY